MIRLDKNRLQSLYPEMTPEFSDRMQRMVQALPERKEEPKMKRKISVGLVLAVVLALAVLTTAVAAGMGLFAQLGQKKYADERLPDLDAVSSPVGQTVTTEDGYSVTIEQAYYDGSRLMISYRLTGELSRLELGEGAPDHVWQDEDQDAMYSIVFGGDDPDSVRLEDWLNRGRECWALHSFAALSDGLYLQDGTYLDIFYGDFEALDDGSVVGWKECRVPAECESDVLKCKAVLFRGETLFYQDGKGIRRDYTHGEDTDIPFTVQKSEGTVNYSGSFLVNDVYTAEASLEMSPFDLAGTVTMRVCEDWYKAWDDWNYQPQSDLISAYSLYAGEERIASRTVEGIGDQAPNTLVFDILTRTGGHTEDLRLVPVYEDSGEHPDEAIYLTRTE